MILWALDLRESGVEAWRSHHKPIKLESWCHRAANERECAGCAGLLPVSLGDDTLRATSIVEIDAKHVYLGQTGWRRDRQLQWRAEVIVPDLDRVDPVPARCFAGF